MKRVKCCTACRRRHRKCVTQPGASQCGTCLESGQECLFENDIRFKHSHSETHKEPERKWAKVPSKIAFTTPQGIDGLALEESDGPSTADTDVTTQPVTQPISGTMMDMFMNEFAPPNQEAVPLHQEQNHWESPSSSITSPLVFDSNGSPYNPSIQVLPVQLHAQSPLELTEREAFLFMTYISKLAPLSDACDDARHFELEVPRLAIRQPMIMNGLLALASLYDDTPNDVESTFYHNKCIKLLIEAFAQPAETWDSTLLTAVVIARLYEENDNETDSYYHHLSGTQNLLNHEVIARFVMQGGLAEAASWVHLRQVIYIYVVRRRPIPICLENFERSTVFRRCDDSAYANRAVYNFAKIMMLFLSMDGPDGNQEGFEVIETEVDQWYGAKPMSFKPVFYNAAHVTSNRPFPTLYFVASVPVVAMQYYYAAKAVLYLRQCNGVQNHNHDKQELEMKISFYLCMLMGLALSNTHVVNAFYLPAHMLSLCGYCIKDLCEQTHAISYLEKVEEAIKWKTKGLIATLKREWGN
ncbi:uncharacterized protein B0J16DRAFT_343504 [Fusarium flagelliforme]|uniref:uncharacterized protein n=1 Tax=Fusarium flagelliforme TaxID=2675880 RepID=UPI001E8DC95D|nr:uncharacterized protein B0J16DRAFT_343504 [Fusarium flagelliforme]KAH7182310.1 hypothetical protein B0J16DRAFT_343504 [Fusarium flagelliforme]